MLDAHNLNWDEGYSTWIVSLPLGEMIETTARDVHPPLYYLLLRTADGLFGTSEFTLRYPSVLLGTLTAAAVFALGKLIGGFRVAVLALLLIAINRSSIDISQLMRMHVLAALFATGGLWATLRIWQNPRRWGAALLYVVCIAGALYSFYLAVVLPLATNLAFLVVWWWRAKHGQEWRRLFVTWTGLQLAAAVLFLPWALYAIQQMHGWSAEQETSLLFFSQVYAVVLAAGVSTFWDPYLPWVLLAYGLLIVGAWRIYRAAWQTRKQKAVDALALTLFSIIAPMLVVFLLTLPFHNLGRPLAARYLVLLSAGFYVLVAWAVLTLMRWRLIVGLGTALLFVGIAAVGYVDTHENQVRQDLFVSLADTVEAHRQPDDGLLLYNDWIWTIFESEYDGAWEKIPYEANINAEYANLILEPLWNENQAVWVVEHPGSRVNDPERHVERWLSERAVASQSWTFNTNTLTVYARTPERAETLTNVTPTYALPKEPVDASLGLLDVEQPMRRYPIGDDVLLSLLWNERPGDTIELELARPEETRSYTFDVPHVSSGPIRQQINIPLTPDFAAGTYTLSLTQPASIDLSTISVVDLTPNLGVAESRIPNRVDWRFGDSIHLLGYDINDNDLRPGDSVEVTLYWRSDDVIDERYKVLVYTLGGWNPQTETPLWGTHDTEPRNWTFPTTSWPPDQVISDEKRYQIAENTPSGQYEIGVVVYGLVDGQRLGIHDRDGNLLGDMATLTTVTVR
jgi:4-amino-4-deoxy-L-arabinose transferase-like glycosyltransferase